VSESTVVIHGLSWPIATSSAKRCGRTVIKSILDRVIREAVICVRLKT
jgi:hypothetical protein